MVVVGYGAIVICCERTRLVSVKETIVKSDDPPGNSVKERRSNASEF